MFPCQLLDQIAELRGPHLLLALGELLHLVAGGLGGDELVEGPRSELRLPPEHGGQGEDGANVGNIRPDPDGDPIQGVSLNIGRIGLVLDHDKGVQEVRVGLLEHDVVVVVSLLLELLGVCLGEGEDGYHVVHHLLAAVLRVHALLFCPAKLGEEQ